MPLLLVIDDRAELRDMAVELAELSLPEGSDWRVAGLHPLPSLDDYAPLIRADEVAVLLIDERLHEQAEATSGLSVSYEGHDLIAHLRQQLPEFPIFVLTAFTEEPDLQEKAPEVEDIISRDSFANNPDKFVKRMTRSGQRFREAIKNELASLAKLAENAAKGIGTDDEKKQMDSIRAKHSLAFPSTDPVYANQLIPQAEQLITEAENLLREISANKNQNRK